MNNEFVQHALSNGAEGAAWLKNIPDIITEYQKRWKIQVAPPFTLSYNYVAPAKRSDGTETVLKIGFPQDKEFQTEVAALEVFRGEGIEKLLEVDKKEAVILIERVTPGVPLSSLDDDEEATKILAAVMKKLWKPLPPNHHFITIKEWMQAIPEYMQKYKGTSSPIPMDLVEKANSLFEELIATSADPMLVHGDLHHDNVLSSNRGGWLAIDPKGIAAEPTYETAAMIRNPYKKIKDQYNIDQVLRRRIQILSDALGFDPERIRKWCFAQSVLSGVWNDAGVKGSDHSINIANVLDNLQI